MPFRWLASLVGVKTGVGKVGIRRRAAPQAQRDLANEIRTHAVQIRRMWLRDVDQEGTLRRTLVVRVAPRRRPDVKAWLTGPAAGGEAAFTIKTSWLLLPHADQAVLIGAVTSDADERALCRFALRFNADADRRYLEALAQTGTLALTAVPLRWGPAQEVLSPHAYVPVEIAPLRDFLRARPTTIV
jgi:hypothetical protein